MQHPGLPFENLTGDGLADRSGSTNDEEPTAFHQLGEGMILTRNVCIE
jgi:hypothetical protein